MVWVTEHHMSAIKKAQNESNFFFIYFIIPFHLNYSFYICRTSSIVGNSTENGLTAEKFFRSIKNGNWSNEETPKSTKIKIHIHFIMD